MKCTVFTGSFDKYLLLALAGGIFLWSPLYMFLEGCQLNGFCVTFVIDKRRDVGVISLDIGLVDNEGYSRKALIFDKFRGFSAILAKPLRR